MGISVEVVGLESQSEWRAATIGRFEGVRTLFGLKTIQVTFVVDIRLLLGVWLEIHCNSMGEYLLIQRSCASPTPL